eukprot:1161575-Pelagomonas_calceolata.AAC.2
MQAGENVGLLLRGIKREDVQRGQVICKPGTVQTYRVSLESTCVLCVQVQGTCRPTAVRRGHSDGHAWRQLCNFSSLLYHVVAGQLRLEEGTQMVMPGDNFRTGIELMLPVALEVGVRFAIRDSGRTVGAGVVTELIGK